MDQTDTVWSKLAPIKAKLALDHVPQKPGLYKLTLTKFDNVYVYIGEAGDLRRRIREHAHNPTEGNYTEHFLFDSLNEADEAELSICCDGELQKPEARRKRKKDAIQDALRQGYRCLNKEGQIKDLLMQRFRLKSKQEALLKELERVRVGLKNLD